VKAALNAGLGEGTCVWTICILDLSPVVSCNLTTVCLRAAVLFHCMLPIIRALAEKAERYAERYKRGVRTQTIVRSLWLDIGDV
jgi:hypothetical protein